MRKIFFLVIVLFAMQHLSAQKFVLMKDTERIESKDSCVYRVEGYDQLISKEIQTSYCDTFAIFGKCVVGLVELVGASSRNSSVYQKV